ncbi:unnamed protein product, partial [Scytosiphon promiscuus]
YDGFNDHDADGELPPPRGLYDDFKPSSDRFEDEGRCAGVGTHAWKRDRVLQVPFFCPRASCRGSKRLTNEKGANARTGHGAEYMSMPGVVGGTRSRNAAVRCAAMARQCFVTSGVRPWRTNPRFIRPRPAGISFHAPSLQKWWCFCLPVTWLRSGTRARKRYTFCRDSHLLGPSRVVDVTPPRADVRLRQSTKADNRQTNI